MPKLFLSHDTPFSVFTDKLLTPALLYSNQLNNQLRECCSLYLIHQILEHSIIPITGSALRYYYLTDDEKEFLSSLYNRNVGVDYSMLSRKLNSTEVLLINDIQVHDVDSYIIKYT